ncbi:hypothetical protein L2E82_38639 [Cichorium intybus]|uniref:Uncharacterized protein n=1 Tax=Cichorium intybus TaxID=13427 RepID=A0ACB9AGK5_CICIN|nr:hypothetical protein L2E82_38639 [Cichorium intybus]
MENRSSMDDLSNPGPGFPQGEGSSNQTSLLDLPDILSIEPLNDEPEIFPELNINLDDPVNVSLDHALDQTPHLLPDPSVDNLSGYNPFIDVPSTSNEIIPMNQEFMTDIQNESQLQTTHNINIEMNLELGVGFQYQNHLQDHVQMIPNSNNNTFELNPSIPTTTAVGSRRGFRHSLSREIIAEHFNEPIEKAAKELNIGSTQLKKRCRDIGIDHWPQRQLKSLQTLIDCVEEFGNEFSGAAGLSKDLLPNLKREKEAIIEGSQSGLTEGTKKLIQAAHKVEYKKRKFLENGETLSRIHTQQKPLPSNSGTSSINPGLLEHASEDNFGGSVGNLAWFPPSYSYPQLVPNWNPSSSLPYLHTPQTSQFLADTHGVTLDDLKRLGSKEDSLYSLVHHKLEHTRMLVLYLAKLALSLLDLKNVFACSQEEVKRELLADVLDEMISRNEILYQYTEEAIDFARTAEEAANSLVTVCRGIRRLLLIILVLLLIGLVSRFRKQGGNRSNTKRECTYKSFMACKPKEFHMKEGAVGLLKWIDSIESVLHISKFTEGNKVEYATCMLQDRALTWWKNQGSRIPTLLVRPEEVAHRGILP